MYPLLAFQRRMWETSPGFEVTPYLSYWMRWKMIWSQQNKDTDPCNNKAPFPSGISILSPCSVARSFNVLSWSVVLKAGCMENPYMLGSTLSYWKKGFYNIVNLTNVLGAIYCTHFQVVSTWAHTVYRNGKVHTHTQFICDQVIMTNVVANVREERWWRWWKRSPLGRLTDLTSLQNIE